MTNRRPPLWLFLDPAAWLPLMFSVWRLMLTVREMLARPDDGRGGLARNDLACMAGALAETEADIDWAIARQVRRLCGLSVADAARVVPAPAQTLQAFHARYGAQVRRTMDCTAIAERRAARARRPALAPLPPSGSSDGAVFGPNEPETSTRRRDHANNDARARAPPAPLQNVKQMLQT